MRRSAHRYHAPPVVSPSNGALGCNGKRSYPNKVVADGQALRSRQMLEEPLEAYKCRACSWWHVGYSGMPRAAKRRPRREMTEDAE